MGAFIQRVNILESSIYELKRDQAAAEARMEAMYLKAQLEITELKNEISEMRLSKSRINQIVKVAESLQGNPYAPYAVKSMVDGVMRSSRDAINSKAADYIKLPEDFPTRLEFAQKNGFKWNQNNRIPSRPAKQLKILEEWENQFCQVENLSVDQALDKAYIVKIGPGAVAGALMMLERELGGTMQERESMSVFNCYQKAIKLYNDNKSASDSKNIARELVSKVFKSVSEEEKELLASRLASKQLGSVAKAVAEVKRIASKTCLPELKWAPEDVSETDKLYAIQAGGYDSQLEASIDSINFL
jgi:hypothetical protein